MIQLIAPSSYGEFSDTLIEMHRLRHRVFKLRLAWDVQTSGDMEIDEFDALHPVYLTQVSENGRVQGSVRLLPSLGPTMLLKINLLPQRHLSGKAADSQLMLQPMLPKEITA
jgi:acyl homoserine lactone synthase